MIVELGIAALAIAGGVYWVAKKQEKHEQDEKMAENFNPSGPDTGPKELTDEEKHKEYLLSDRYQKMHQRETEPSGPEGDPVPVFDPASGPGYVSDPATGPGVDDIRKSRRYEWLKNRETEDSSGPSGPN